MKKTNKLLKNKNYDIKRLQICPFERVKCGESTLIHPLRNEGYGFVLCVCDFANQKVYDIVNNHEYKYIELMSGFMLNKITINDQQRYAICPLYVSDYELTNDEIERINSIINKLEEGKQNNTNMFINGNYVMTNEEYRISIDKYNEEVVKKNKVKRIKMGK